MKHEYVVQSAQHHCEIDMYLWTRSLISSARQWKTFIADVLP
jgi:hypothetical protein